MNYKKITRRDFLKTAGLLPLSFTPPRLLNAVNAQQSQQNVLIIVFDAFSARNMSLYGYQRETTPNMTRLAERAVVYHNHYAAGNFTTPGTAALLSGTLPWTNRAFTIGGALDKVLAEKNIFSAFQDYHRTAYTHNNLVDMMLRQFKKNIDDLIKSNRLFVKEDFVPPFFEKDEDTFRVSWVRSFEKNMDGYSYSIFLSYLNGLKNVLTSANYSGLRAQFPRGIPGVSDFPGHSVDYTLEDAIDWLQGNLGRLPQPFLGYFHFYPPHIPYRTHREFYNRFQAETLHVQKPLDMFADTDDFSSVDTNRTYYDEFILYLDREFGRLFDHLDKSRLLENTWVILTSDHGELFERGIIEHVTPVLYEPVIRIPLIIFEPGRLVRQDVYTPTSAIDVFPTVLHVTEQQPANWAEGVVLPPYSDSVSAMENSRNIYVLEAKKNDQYGPLTTATVALIKGQYKLMYFFGYEELGAKVNALNFMILRRIQKN